MTRLQRIHAMRRDLRRAQRTIDETPTGTLEWYIARLERLHIAWKVARELYGYDLPAFLRRQAE